MFYTVRSTGFSLNCSFSPIIYIYIFLSIGVCSITLLLLSLLVVLSFVHLLLDLVTSEC